MRETIGVKSLVPAIKPFPAVIVDDEEDARDNLRYMLQQCPGNMLQIVGTACNISDAQYIINELRPEVVFLDIDLANETAFTLLERLKPIDFEIVFVTAYDEYAIKAFKLNAVDYVVKPIDKDDLQAAIDKLKEKIINKKIIGQYSNEYKHIAEEISTKATTQRIIVRNKGTVNLVHFNDVVLIEADRSYSKVIFQKNGMQQNVTMSYSIAEYEELLPDSMFYRVHKSYLVNCRHVTKIVKDEHPYVIVDEQIKVPISRRKYTEFIVFLKSIDINV